MAPSMPELARYLDILKSRATGIGIPITKPNLWQITSTAGHVYHQRSTRTAISASQKAAKLLLPASQRAHGEGPYPSAACPIDEVDRGISLEKMGQVGGALALWNTTRRLT